MATETPSTEQTYQERVSSFLQRVADCERAALSDEEYERYRGYRDKIDQMRADLPGRGYGFDASNPRVTSAMIYELLGNEAFIDLTILEVKVGRKLAEEGVFSI